MIAGVIIKPLKLIPDDRGFLMEMLRADDPIFERFGQVYITGCKEGVAKAWHYHKEQTDRALADLMDMQARGTYHVTDACEGISWYEFAVAITETVGAQARVKPVSTVEFPRPARRPSYSVLSVAETTPTLGYELSTWRDSLHSMLAGVSSKKVMAEP